MNAVVIETNCKQEVLLKPQPVYARPTLLLIAVLVLSVVVAMRGIRQGEFSYNVDETQHAVTGLYVADVLRDRPVTHPLQYTYHYYAQYPALSGVIHWPPFFYLWEGLFFLIFGPTVVAARLSILFFTVVGLSFFFLLVRELQDDWAAAFSTVLLALAPGVLLFEKTVMLEIPSLALSLGAIFCWTRYLLHGRMRQIYGAAVFASLAMLTKQNAIFLAPFFLLTALWVNGWQWFRRSEAIRFLLVTFVMTAPFYVLVYIVHWNTIAMDLEDKKISGLGRLLFYWKVLPAQLGWLLLLLSLLGMLAVRRWDRPRAAGLMLIWIASCYLTFTAIGLKETRYVIYWVPAFAYFAGSLITRVFRKPALLVSARIAAIVVLGVAIRSAWGFQRPLVWGYAEAAKQIVQLHRAGVILYDAELPGNFIFFMRADDPERQFVVLRKALYTYRIKKSGGGVELIHTRQELEQLIREDGVRFVVVTKDPRHGFDSERILREMVVGPEFRLVGDFPISGDDGPRQSSELQVFEKLNWAPPTSKFLEIKMLTLGHPIVVPFAEYKFAQTQNVKGDPAK